MPRGLTPTQKAAIATGPVALPYFVEIQLDTSLRVWNGVGDKTALAKTWKGLGVFGIIDGIEGDRSLTDRQITLAVVGVPGDSMPGSAVAATRALRYQGRRVNVYFGIANPDTGALIDDIILAWAGFADVMSFQLGSTFSCALSCDALDSLMRRPNGWNMTTVSHNQRFGLAPGSDLFFEAQNRLMGVPKPLLA